MYVSNYALFFVIVKCHIVTRENPRILTENKLKFCIIYKQIYSMENDEWFIDPFGPLQIGQVYHSCAICGDHLYTFGGDVGSDALNNSESYTGIIQKCDLNGECEILDIAYNNVRYPRATSINDEVIILAGGQFSASEYTHNVDMFDCRNDEMIAAPDLPSPLTEFQMVSILTFFIFHLFFLG